MTPATPHIASANTVVNAIVAAIQAVQTADGKAAFVSTAVVPYDDDDFERFETEFTSRRQRQCAVVPGTEDYTEESNTNSLRVRRTLPIMVVISDEAIGRRTQALFGGPNNVGAIALCELVIPAVTGQLIPNPAGVVCRPVNRATTTVSVKEPRTANRAAVVLELSCTGGWYDAALDGMPNI